MKLYQSQIKLNLVISQKKKRRGKSNAHGSMVYTGNINDLCNGYELREKKVKNTTIVFQCMPLDFASLRKNRGSFVT